MTRGVLVGGVLLAALASPGLAHAAACGLPDAKPVWVEFGEGSVPPEVRSVFSRRGVVVATSGANLGRLYRERGAATVHWHMRLQNLVGTPSAPGDPANIPAAADGLMARAIASSGCQTPWIGLNELAGPALGTPWSATNAQYRANILALVQRVAARGGRAFLLVHGNPNVAGDAAEWWRQVAASGVLLYEAYYNARNIDALGPILGNRRMRSGMRSIVRLFTGIGIPRSQLGFILGFHVGPNTGSGREGLQPREDWFRVVKWEALAARQVARDEAIPTIWSWGWGTFGPESTDPDKPAAACVYLWTRDPKLCDGPALAGPAFNASRTEGQILLPRGTQCVIGPARIGTAALTRTTAVAGDRALAFTTLFARLVQSRRARVSSAEMLAFERAAVRRAFGGSRGAYKRALAERHASVAVARAVIADELRRRKLARVLRGTSVLAWTVQREQEELLRAICLRDELPAFGVSALPSALRFLFTDRKPPKAPAGLAAGATGLDWADSVESDLLGYEVYRAPMPGGPYVLLTPRPLVASTFVDRTAPKDVPSYYVVRAVDVFGNRSTASVEVAVVPSSPL